MPGGTAAMVTLCWSLRPPICAVKVSTPAVVPVWKGSTAMTSPGAMANVTLRPPAAKAMAESAGPRKSRVAGPGPLGCVEADGQRALLCAGRLLEVQRDDGFGQRRIDAGAEQRVAPVAERQRPLPHP